MAIYHLEVQIIGRSDGRSAIASAAYRAGEAITDERTGTVHMHGDPARVMHTEIMAPANAPAWMFDRSALWNGVEKIERRKDAQLAREFEVALPNELDRPAQIALLRGFAESELLSWGMVVDFTVHAQMDPDRPKQDHAHLMIPTRTVAQEDGGFGAKARELNDWSMVPRWRESWADHVNAALEQAGFESRVDHRSHADRGLEDEPTIKEGAAAHGRVARGLNSDRIDLNRAIRARNKARREKLDEMKAAVRASRPSKEKPIAKSTRRVVLSSKQNARGIGAFGRPVAQDRVRGLPRVGMGARIRATGRNVPEIRVNDVRSRGSHADGLRGSGNRAGRARGPLTTLAAAAAKAAGGESRSR